MKAILTANPSLEQLSMYANGGVAHETFAHMLTTLTQLNSLQLIGEFHCVHDYILSIWHSFGWLPIRQGWRIGSDARSVSSIEQLPDLFAHLTRIEIKDIALGDKCDTRLVRMLLERAPRLRCLIMNQCARVDDAAFDKVRICGPIEHLALNNFKVSQRRITTTLHIMSFLIKSHFHTLISIIRGNDRNFTSA